MKRWPLRISPRRAAFGGTLCLILGVVTTVGVALACALWSIEGEFYSPSWTEAHGVTDAPVLFDVSGPFFDGDPVRGTGLSYTLRSRMIVSTAVRMFRRYVSVREPERARGLGAFLLRVPAEGLDDRAEGVGLVTTLTLARHDPDMREFAEPLWRHVNGARAADRTIDAADYEDANFALAQLQTGWPMPSLIGGYRVGWGAGQTSRGADDVQMHSAVWLEPMFLTRDRRLLPLRPIFPGFLINTLFYAAIWFGVFFVMGRTRRFIRTRRGRCPRCGYDLRGEFDDGCSECGWNRGREGTEASRQQGIEEEDDGGEGERA